MFETLKPYKNLIFLVLGLLALIGLILFIADRFSSSSDNRGNEKRKAEIKQELANIEVKQQQIANLQTEVAIEKDRVKEKTEDLLNAANASNDAREQTNAALTNMNTAKNANTTNTSVKELEKLLDQLQ